MLMVITNGMFCVGVLIDMKCASKEIFMLFTDSQSGRDTVVNPGVTKHSVHFEGWMHYVRDCYLRGKIRVTHVLTAQMRADNMTKVVDKAKFLFCRKYQLNLTDLYEH